jgi:HlyD family secretion protein
MSLNFVTQSKGKSSPVLAISAAAVLSLAAAGVAWTVWKRAIASPGVAVMSADQYFRVKPMSLDVTVVQNGELQAVDNIDLISKVEGRTTITEIVKEGAYVRTGEVLVKLDSASIRQQIDDITLELERAEASVSNAREMLAIQESNNAAELEGASVALLQTELDFKKYVEGTHPQEEKTATTKLDMARINLQNKLDDLQQSKSLFTRGFVTAADVKKADLAVTEARNSVQEAETALRVLRDYNHQADLAAKKNAVAQAKSKLERVRRQNESMIVQKTADLNSAIQQLQLRKRKLESLQEQLAACTLTAPTDGMVVYSNNPDRNESVIQEGAEVRERQPILRLPDVSTMKAVLKLNEAQANRVQVGMNASLEITGVLQPLTGTVSKVSIVPVSGNRWMNPDSKDYPAEILLDYTPSNLKPSTSVRSTITIKSLGSVLAVPLEAIYSAGSQAYVFVDEVGKPVPREVKLGESSLTHVEVRSGLSEDEMVLRLEAGQGKRLLDEAGIKIEPATQPTGPRTPRMNGAAGPGAAGAAAAPGASGGERGEAGAAGNGERRRRPEGTRPERPAGDLPTTAPAAQTAS